MTITPTADELLDFMQEHCLLVNVASTKEEPETMVSDCTPGRPPWHGPNVRAVLTQAYRDLTKPSEPAATVQTSVPPFQTNNETP